MTVKNEQTIRMYSTSWCPDCHRAKDFLKSRGVAFEEIEIEERPEAAEIVMRENDGKRRVPTLEIDGNFHGNPSLARLGELVAGRDGDGKRAPSAAFEKADWTGAETRSMVIVGTGPAGLTAALYGARADLEPLVLRGAEPGGQLVTTTEVENFPGFPDGILGPELIERFEKQAERFGAELRYGTVTAVDLSERPFRLLVDEEMPLLAETIVISTGASAKYLGLENERRLLGRGVSACATCDGAFFREKRLAVVGGGDTALEEALFLTRFTDDVTVIHRRNELRASKVMQDRVRKNDKIRFLFSRTVEDVLGEDEVEAIVVKDMKTGETSRLALDGLFVAIGHKPNTDLFRGVLDMDEVGYLRTEGASSVTNVPGVFASGDVQDPHYRQAITAAGSGATAALDAERFLAEAGVAAPVTVSPATGSPSEEPLAIVV